MTYSSKMKPQMEPTTMPAIAPPLRPVASSATGMLVTVTVSWRAQTTWLGAEVVTDGIAGMVTTALFSRLFREFQMRGLA
jgi:hypothetical protein